MVTKHGENGQKMENMHCHRLPLCSELICHCQVRPRTKPNECRWDGTLLLVFFDTDFSLPYNSAQNYLYLERVAQKAYMII